MNQANSAPVQRFSYLLKDKVEGPFDLIELAGHLKCSNIDADTLVCREGEQDWLAFRELPEFVAAQEISIEEVALQLEKKERALRSSSPSKETKPSLLVVFGIALCLVGIAGSIDIFSPDLTRPAPVPVVTPPATVVSPPPPAPVITPPQPVVAPPPLPAAVGPVAGQEWTNSLGVKFVPAGTDGVLFSVWDVRVQDFRAFVQATSYTQPGGIYVMKIVTNANWSRSIASRLDPNASWENPGFDQGPTHPVVGVSWNDANAFCQWLTDKERKEGTLGPNQSYRLPTDAEWSAAVGYGTYPWGDVWPPPIDAGNYADQAYAASLPGEGWNCLPENDGYPRTSPVGSFRANTYGLYDMGGNVWQWCADWYNASMNSDEVRQSIPELDHDGGGTTFKVVRGASWCLYVREHLLSTFRFYDDPSVRADHYGFRVVLEVSPKSGSWLGFSPRSQTPLTPFGNALVPRKSVAQMPALTSTP